MPAEWRHNPLVRAVNDYTPRSIRQQIRNDEFEGPTVSAAPGFIQANLVMLHDSIALEFASFCVRNPLACPLLDVLAPGATESYLAPDSDIRTDVSRYRVYHNGALLEEISHLGAYWSKDMVTFVLDGSSRVDNLLAGARVPLRHVEQNVLPPVYETRLACQPAGPFRGPLLATMRPIPSSQAAPIVRLMTRTRRQHMIPLHIGEPAELGIADLGRTERGTPILPGEHELPAFWADSLITLAIITTSRPPLAITNAPGHRFITDLRAT